MPVSEPAMLVIAHGSSDSAAASTVSALCERVSALRPQVSVHVSYLDHCRPTPDDMLAAMPPGPVVVVPLLLVGAYHARTDVAAVVDRARAVGRDVRMAAVLSPDPLLLDIAEDLLDASGAAADSAVVLASAGSTDSAANATTAAVAAALAARRGSSAAVLAAYASAGQPSVAHAIRQLLDDHADVVVLRWLLAPGRFAEAMADEADAAGVRVTAILGTHPGLAELVGRRYDAAAWT